MKANELRIGNYFIDVLGNYCQAGSIQQVKSISSTGVNQWQDMGASGECKFKDMLPVPIIEERLLKFGFKKKYELWVLMDELNEYEVFEIEENGIGYILSINGGEYTEGNQFKYVHSLQNLYFALKGKEL